MVDGHKLTDAAKISNCVYAWMNKILGSGQKPLPLTKDGIVKAEWSRQGQYNWIPAAWTKGLAEHLHFTDPVEMKQVSQGPDFIWESVPSGQNQRLRLRGCFLGWGTPAHAVLMSANLFTGHTGREGPADMLVSDHSLELNPVLNWEPVQLVKHCLYECS